ncbi:MAG: VOC family protein [Hespellia sp.]|nr:VOC family protein [Hespellia sp.]
MTKAKSISIITLGVKDLSRSITFYEKLGWECSPESDPAVCTYMLADNIVLGLVPYEFLGNDVGLKVEEKREYCGFTLAINGADAREVDELFSLAKEAGGKVWQEPQWKDWGGCEGYSGYFLDPDGYPWEVAYASSLKLSEDHRLLPKRK